MSKKKRPPRKQEIVQIPTLGWLKNYLSEIYENPDSLIFLASKTNLKKVLTTSKGVKELLTSGLEEEVNFGRAIKPFHKENQWIKLVDKWYEQNLEKRDVTHDRDKPRNIANYDSALKSIPGPNHTYQGDLMHMDWLNPDKKKHRYAYSLVVVDVYSTFLYMYPVRKKDAVSTSRVLENFFSNTRKTNKTRYFQTDLGTEFFNREAEQVYKRWNVQHYHTNSMQKAYLAERKIRQVKNFFNEMKRSRLLDKVIRSQGVKSYNSDDWTSITKYAVQKINKKRHTTTRYTPLEMDAPRDGSPEKEIRHLFIRERLQNNRARIKRKAEKIDPFTRFKNRKELTRALPIGTRVYITKARKKGVNSESPFSKPSTRNSLWDKDTTYVVHGRIDNHKNPSLPSFRYILREGKTKKILAPRFYREELHVVNDATQKNLYDSKKQYRKEYLEKWHQL